MPFAATWIQLKILILSDRKRMTNTISVICGVQTMAQMNLSTKQKQSHRHGEWTCGCQGGRGGNGIDQEFGVSRCKVLHLNGQAMRSYSTAQKTVSSLLGQNMIEDDMRKICVCVCVCVYTHIHIYTPGSLCYTQNLAQYCKTIILYKIKYKKEVKLYMLFKKQTFYSMSFMQ